MECRFVIDLDTVAFQAHLDGAKAHEVIRDDSERIGVGDVVVLREVVAGMATGRRIERHVSYRTSASSPCALSDAGLRAGHSILSLVDPAR